MTENCCVCDYPAEGQHFGALCCKACAAFFRRSCAENKRYQCRESGKCDVRLDLRNNCRSCRLRKCFEAGMKKECIEGSSDSDPDRDRASPSPPEVSPDFSLLTAYAPLHSTFFQRQISLFNLLNEKLSIFPNSEGETQFLPITIETHNTMEKGNADLIASLLADNFPIFKNLSKSEKHEIFGPFAVRFINFHRCWLTAKYFPTSEEFAFHYGYYYHFDDIDILFGLESKTEQIYKLIAPTNKTLKNFSEKLLKLCLNDIEKGVLIGLILYQQMELHGLLPGETAGAHKELLTTFHAYLLQNNGVVGGGLRFANVLGILTDLEIISTSWNNMMILGGLAIPHYDKVFMLVADTLAQPAPSL